MNVDDFILQPRGPRLFDHWSAKQPLKTSIGQFEINLYKPPDDELVRCASEQAEFVATHCGDILEIVYDHYLRTCEHKQWMRGCEVPVGLARNKVARYIRNCSITVNRNKHGKLWASIFVVPQWDTEHGIPLRVRDGLLILDDD